jgi:hypothetical protein
MDEINLGKGLVLNGNFRCYSIFGKVAVDGIDPTILSKVTKRRFITNDSDENGRVFMCEMDGFVRMRPDECFFCWTFFSTTFARPGSTDSIRTRGGRGSIQLLPVEPVAGSFYGAILLGLISPGDNIYVFRGGQLPIAELSLISDGRDKRSRPIYNFKVIYKSEIW